jgi:CrcB protein
MVIFEKPNDVNAYPKLMKIIYLLTGGAIGTVGRYALSGLTYRYLEGTFPYGTLLVNLLGSLLIGFLWGIFETENMSPGIRNFIFIGLLGGFTTFSTYSLETLNLARDGELKLAMANILANNLGGLLLVIIGFIVANGLTKLIR